MMELDLRMGSQRDTNALARAVLLLALTGFLVKLVLRGELPQYIHPKFTWFTASAGLGLTLMAAGQLRRWWQSKASVTAPLRYGLYTAVAAVVCGGFLLQPHTFGADLAAKQGLNLTNRSTNRPAADSAPPPGPGVAPSTAGQQASTPEVEPAKVPTEAQPGTSGKTQPQAVAATPAAADSRERLDLTPQNYVLTMTDLYQFPEKHAGKRISMDGFAFYPPDVAADQFALVRLVVTCHVAHAYPDGLIAYFPGQAERPPQDRWYRLEGILEPFIYREKVTLRLKIEKSTPIEAPADPYVYP